MDNRLGGRNMGTNAGRGVNMVRKSLEVLF